VGRPGKGRGKGRGKGGERGKVREMVKLRGKHYDHLVQE